jgi:16S rRNA (cytosine967-C5)-methyltransferase
MRFEQQLRGFLKALNEFSSDMPLARFLHEYFKRNRQMGSTDRKVTSRLLYSYFRLGKACTGLAADQRLFIAEFLCSTAENPFLNYFRPDLHGYISEPLDKKIALLTEEKFLLDDVFPCIFLRELNGRRF